MGTSVAVSVVGGGSSWSVTSGAYTYTINGTSYSSSYQLYFGRSGSTSSRCIQIALDGPCTIYIAARSGSSSSYSSRTVYAYVNSSSIGSMTVSSNSSVSVSTISYTGTGGTLSVYGSGSVYIYHIEIDYNV